MKLIGVFLLLIFAGHSMAASERTAILKFEHSPFPYRQDLTQLSEKPFFDVIENGRRGHTSRRGGLYWEDTTYNDNSVLVSIPPKFSLYKPAYILVYLHGNQSILERDLLARQHIPEQLAASGLNAILIAPQFAVDALDSSPGHFADINFFSEFLNEAAQQIGDWQSNPLFTKRLSHAKVILVAYSGGYYPAAFALKNGGADKRISGIVLLDALYGQEDTFANFLHNNCHSFFFSTYTEPAREPNENLMNMLREQKRSLKMKLPRQVRAGGLMFVPLGPQVDHVDLLSKAWDEDTLFDVLRRIKLN